MLSDGKRKTVGREKAKVLTVSRESYPPPPPPIETLQLSINFKTDSR